MSELASCLEDAARYVSLLHQIELAVALGEDDRVHNLLAGVDPIDCAATVATLRVLAVSLRSDVRAVPTEPRSPLDGHAASAPAESPTGTQATARITHLHPGFSVKA